MILKYVKEQQLDSLIAELRKRKLCKIYISLRIIHILTAKLSLELDEAKKLFVQKMHGNWCRQKIIINFNRFMNFKYGKKQSILQKI